MMGLKRNSKGRILVAIDDPSLPSSKVRGLIDGLKSMIAGFKIGVPYILGVGLSEVAEIIKDHKDTYFLADLKLADIDAIMKLTAKLARDAGFNGIIAHGFIGYEGGLAGLSSYCSELGLDLYVVTSMSHPGSSEIYDKVLDDVLGVVKRIKATGVVAPATRPSIIRYIRNYIGMNYIIISPGVGAQGAEPGSAICSGADFEIVGRAITSSVNPVEATKNLIVLQEKNLRMSGCLGGTHAR